VLAGLGQQLLHMFGAAEGPVAHRNR
jgi:hypothetical protein